MPAERLGSACTGAASYLGALQHELHTDAQPYRWTIYLQQDIVAARVGLMESDMRSFAYVLLGIIGNLDEVTYSYTVDGQEQSLTVTTEDASDFFGQNIKDCGSSCVFWTSCSTGQASRPWGWPSPHERI